MALPAAMVVTMAALAFVGLVGFALVAGRLRGALDRPRVSRAVNVAVGGLQVGVDAVEIEPVRIQQALVGDHDHDSLGVSSLRPTYRH